MDASHVYVRALALGCFYSHISTRTFRRALTASLHGQLRGDKEYLFSGVTKSSRVGGGCQKAVPGVSSAGNCLVVVRGPLRDTMAFISAFKKIKK